MMVPQPLPLEDMKHVLEQTRELWEEARGQSFFITGGTGFFGMWLLESFVFVNETLGLKARATVLTRSPAAFRVRAPHLIDRGDLEFVTGDVRTFPFPGGQFPFVIHASAQASARLNEEAPLEMIDTIIAGTRRVLNFASQVGVRKLLFISSGAVYGRQPETETHVAENSRNAPDPLLPGSAYGEGKRVSEHMCVVDANGHGYEAKIARCFTFVGPHLPLDAHFAIGNFIRDAMGGKPIKVSGDGTDCRSYLYASDLAIWLWTLLFRGSPGRAYNVGSPHSIAISELASEVAAALGSTGGIRIAQPQSPEKLIARYVPDVSRAAAELGLRVTVPQREAIRKTAAWHDWHSNHGSTA